MSKKKYLYPHPNKPGEMVSRQRLWQIKKSEKGRCRYCGRKAFKNGKCYDHWLAQAILNREIGRRRYGWKTRYNSLTYRLKQPIS